MVTTGMESTRGLTYSVSGVIDVTAWQSDDAVSLCFLTHGSCHWTQISSGYSNGGYTISALVSFPDPNNPRTDRF